MRDMLGNRLEKGSLVRWDVSGVVRDMGGAVIAHVVDIVESQIAGADGAVPNSASVVLQVVIHMNVPPNLPKDRLQIAQLMRVVDPASETAVDRVLDVLPSGRLPIPPTRKPQ